MLVLVVLLLKLLVVLEHLGKVVTLSCSTSMTVKLVSLFCNGSTGNQKMTVVLGRKLWASEWKVREGLADVIT